MTTKPAPNSRPKKASKPQEKPETGPSQPPITPEDDLALDRFCNDLVYEEISFDSWQQTLDNLDLTVPLWLPQDSALLGGEFVVRFCRSIRDTPPGPARREPSSCLVAVPANTRCGDRLVVTAQGDRIATRSGDLIVIVRVKASKP